MKANEEQKLKPGENVAGWVTLIKLSLAAAKGAIGFFANSPALLADAFHSAADVIAIFASWFGLRLSRRRPDERFPYGYYKAETLASLLVSLLILYAGFSLFKKGFELLWNPSVTALVGIVLVTAMGSALVSLITALWTKRVGKQIGSQSLLANADDNLVDSISSLIVFMAVYANTTGFQYAEAGATIGISFFVVWLGIKNTRIAVFGLMDASLDPQMEKEITKLVLSVKGIKEVENLRLRKAGLFRFGEAHIRINPSVDVNRGHILAHQASDLIRQRFPSVESFTVHIEPYRGEKRRIMIPVENEEGLDAPVMSHFGKARYFLFADLQRDKILSVRTEKNEFQDNKTRVGLDVVNYFISSRGVDVILTKEIGEIGYHALRDSYVDIYQSEGNYAGEDIDYFQSGKLNLLTNPTHSCDEEI